MFEFIKNEEEWMYSILKKNKKNLDDRNYLFEWFKDYKFY